MVLEALVSPKHAERSPRSIIALSFLFASIAIFIVQYLYPRGSGMLIIAFTVMPAIPLVWHMTRLEEEEEEDADGCQRSLLRIYKPIFETYALFFVGMVVAFSFWMLVLPHPAAEALFFEQNNEYHAIRTAFSANAVQQGIAFDRIFWHNLNLLIVMMALSLIYEIGAVLLMAWNASLVATFIAHSVRDSAAGSPLSVLGNSTLAFFQILPHGIFEFSAYFVGSISMGILSAAIERRAYRKRCFVPMMVDIAKLALLAVALLAAGAAIESSYA